MSVLVLLWSSINRTLELRRDYAVYLSPLHYFVLTVFVAVLVIIAIAAAPVVDVLAEQQLHSPLSTYSDRY